ncbi:MmcQ/YjbR family DNA-binding protein [Fructobacillus sp. M1-13]|uniref:MmcQ/YjbR family DNA-binding protein n=1 Tax=Fructobacillus papyriferae TaxID=2713171 RepID=A0ABS5QPA8_9LACO|nr:MmcQ/YjbR family DNA-binding protein [Fructobacillus papyriferae]MBS9334637.1 MmcQ/YjbR family DNA-binding protein [Fructobacillus papyriferae]MCD2158627.1 MmcQ/YjbR family DNA-binding protein [Fructobacillus papyriferae]
MQWTRNELIDFTLKQCQGYLDHPFNGEHSPEKMIWSVIKQQSNQKMIAMIFEKAGHLLIDLKLEPEHGQEMRDLDGVYPGYHMNKKHWNTVDVNRTEVSQTELANMIQESAKLTE